MGVAISAFRLRDSDTNTVGSFVETANTLWKALEDAGMVRVPTSDYAGQAGRLTTAVPGVGETQISALGSGTSLGAEYYNVYKHPVLQFFIRASVFDTGFNGASHRSAIIRWAIFFDLNGMGSHASNGYQQYIPLDVGVSTSMGTSSTGIPATYKSLAVSVGPDHLCVAGEALHFPTNETSYRMSFNWKPGRTSYGFSVLADTDGAGSLVVVMPPPCSNIQSGSSYNRFSWGALSSPSYDNAYQYTAIRYWTYEPGAKLPLFRGGAAAGFIIDPASPASTEGIRIQQAQLYIGGVLRRFNFGFAPEGAVPDQSNIKLNLTGLASQNYRVTKGYGPANPAIGGYDNAQGYDSTSNSCILLPWDGV